MTRLVAARGRWAVLFVLGLCGPIPTFAQETTTGSLTGQVVDSQDLAVPGATIIVSSEQGAKTHVTDAHGRFLAPYLTPGLFTVRVELQGFVPVEQRDIKVRLGQRLDLRFVMQPGALTEEVNVIAVAHHRPSAPAAPARSSTTSSSAACPSAAGSPTCCTSRPASAPAAARARPMPPSAERSGLENNYILDGVNISDAGYGAAGSYSTHIGSPGNAITFDFIKEIQVKTAGFEAEFGQSTGGIVNVITKSGTNAFKGSVFAYLQPERLSSDCQQITTRNGTVNTTGTTDKEGGFTLGGPADEGPAVLLRRRRTRSTSACRSWRPPGFPLAAPRARCRASAARSPTPARPPTSCAPPPRWKPRSSATPPRAKAGRSARPRCRGMRPLAPSAS